MVCLGNICRSPMAEGIFHAAVEQAGLDVAVDSAGTANYHENERPDLRAISTAGEHGIDLSALRGRQFVVEDFDNFDRIYAMDSSNQRNILALARNDSDKEKVHMFLDLIHPGEGIDVPDPYYGGDEGFENVFKLLNQASEKLIEELKSGD